MQVVIYKRRGLNQEQITPLIRLLQFNEMYDALQRGDSDPLARRFPNPFVVPFEEWDATAFVGENEATLKKFDELKLLNPNRRKLDYSFGIELLGFAARLFDINETLAAGLNELAEIESLFQAAGYVEVVKRSNPIAFALEKPKVHQIIIDLTVVRGLEYYTGAGFRGGDFAHDDNERPIRLGSVGGGGRYDGLVSRFRGEPVPATGFSIGVSRCKSCWP